MWARIINTMIGIWMMIAPGILNYKKAASNNAYITGALIATVAIISMAESVRDVRIANRYLGAWLIIAPWILTFQTGMSVLNDTLAGPAVIFLSMVKGTVKEKFGGGWKSVFKPDIH